MERIENIAKKIGADFSLYGNDIAKVKLQKGNKNGKLILVTAMTSNKSGIGKTTISIGLADSMHQHGMDVMLSLREPSMGPVFGIKGGATGGGKSSLFPSDEINLHFTGDFHAITQATNLLASVVDNHIFQGNQLQIEQVFVKRCLDLNERSLRNITYQIGDRKVETGFVITASSEIMAILALSKDVKELKSNLGNILVGLNKNGEAIFARDLHCEDALTILLKDAIKPNLVQTLDATACLVHLGPFANIAHGTSSQVSIEYALSHADYVVTEAGFGSDLGGEKFLDIVARKIGKFPSAVVLVVTLSVVKEHGEGDLEKGFENVKRHIENLKNVYGINCVVAINKHSNDDETELARLKKLCGENTCVCEAFTKGGQGCDALLELVKKSLAQNTPKYCYDLNDTIEEKIEKIATKIYGAGKVTYTEIAKEKIALAKRLGFDKFFVNIAKTQFSFSQDKSLLGAPKNFEFSVTDVEIRSGAKMIVAIAGNMLLMPALGKNSNYLNMKIDDNGNVEGIM